MRSLVHAPQEEAAGAAFSISYAGEADACYRRALDRLIGYRLQLQFEDGENWTADLLERFANEEGDWLSVISPDTGLVNVQLADLKGVHVW